jgi:hypothetical protein
MNAIPSSEEQAELDRIAIENDATEGRRVANAVHAFLGRFIAYPSAETHDAHTLWIMHTHLMKHWDITPRIAFLSPEPGSGKSRALEVTKTLVPNPVHTVNVSPAYLIRKVGSDDGVTVLFDEIDTIFGPKTKDNNEDIRGLLNAGYERGATCGRCVVKGKAVETEEIPAYAAVALAGLGWLPDTVLTRSVIVRMKRRKPGQTVESYRKRIHQPQGEVIRFRIERWAMSAEPTLPEPDQMPEQIQDRDADIWEPLIAVADVVGGEWPERARKAGVTLVTVAKDIEPSLGIKLLSDIRTLFTGLDIMASKDLVAELVKLEESPWADLHGRELDNRGLAKRLREYEIKPAVHRIGTGTVRGYRKSDFADAWASYLPASPARGVTSVTSVTDGNLLLPDTQPADQLVTDVTSVTQFQGERDDPADWSVARLEAEWPDMPDNLRRTPLAQ